MKYFDQHLHSDFSFDSKEPVINYVCRAESRNVKYLVTTEHLEFDLDHTGKDALPDFLRQREVYDEISKEHPAVTLMQGVEVGYNAQRLSDVKRVLNSFPFDLINLSVHDYKGYDMYAFDFAPEDADEILKYNFSTIAQAVSDDIDFDILCHVDYAFKSVKKKIKDLKIDLYADFLEKIFKIIVKREKALEINIRVQRSIDDQTHLKTLLSIYKRAGGKLLALSDDAHRLNDYLNETQKYAEIIKSCGFDSLRFYIRRKPIDVNIDQLF